MAANKLKGKYINEVSFVGRLYERKAIAKRGQEKVLECYNYEKKLTKIMEWVEGN